MDRQAAQLALAAQMPLAGASQSETVYKTELIAEIKSLAWRKLRYNKAHFEQWAVACLQVEAWFDGLLQLASVEQLSLMLDRLNAQIEAASDQYAHVVQADYWQLANSLRAPRPKALEIIAAWTVNDTIDWPYAYEELMRRFGRASAAA